MAHQKIFLITGGLGFIGKHFVRRCLEEGHVVRNFDAISYAADLEAHREFSDFANYRFQHVDIRSIDFLPESDVLINFAAESHVDNAISSNRKFCDTNFLGVQNLLELVRRKQVSERPRFIQISTDEVYGDIVAGQHRSADPLRPSNPYSATKAAADMLVTSWGRTYEISWNIVRPSNNYGLHQYPEKLIPKSAFRMRRGQPAILHGDGSYVRSWLHAEDTVDAILSVVEKGATDTIYNVGANTELANIEVVRGIADILEIPHDRAWILQGDRIGQDVRYSVEDSDLRALGWAPRRDFFEELVPIVQHLDVLRFQ